MQRIEVFHAGKGTLQVDVYEVEPDGHHNARPQIYFGTSNLAKVHR